MKTILFFMSGYSWAEVRYRDAVFQCARAQDANASEIGGGVNEIRRQMDD